MNLPPRISKLILLGIPLLIATLAIAQDLHLIADFNACVKDIVFVCLMLQLILHAGVGEKLKAWLGVVVLAGVGKHNLARTLYGCLASGHMDTVSARTLQWLSCAGTGGAGAGDWSALVWEQKTYHQQQRPTGLWA